MRMSREHVLDLVGEFRQGLAKLYAARLKGVYLYGSCARGDADSDSDIDVAVVLTGSVDHERELRRTSELRAGLSLRRNCVLMQFFLTADDFDATPCAIHRNIVKEAVPFLKSKGD